jgi:hypothetical protein
MSPNLTDMPHSRRIESGKIPKADERQKSFSHCISSQPDKLRLYTQIVPVPNGKLAQTTILP